MLGSSQNRTCSRFDCSIMLGTEHSLKHRENIQESILNASASIEMYKTHIIQPVAV